MCSPASAAPRCSWLGLWCNQRWPVLPILRRLLERIRQLQHAELVLMASDNLHADGQAFRREAARHGDGGQTRHRHEVARAHPVNVGLHLYAVNLRDVGLLHSEWGHLTDRANHELVGLHKFTDTMIERRALGRDARQLWPSDALARFDVPDQRVLHQMAVGLQQLAITQGKIPRAPRFENLISVTEVGRAVFDDSAERLKGRALRVNGCGHAGVNGQATEGAIPCHPYALEVTPQGARKRTAGLRDTDGHTVVRAS